ncbi:MAG: hypothetical protein HFI73_02315 [Bacilli bacterium]|jgi:hypothetical protein|nr:hypothetical protein [Bacilli bacterium]
MKKKVIVVITLSLVITVSLVLYNFMYFSKKETINYVTNEIKTSLDLINDIVGKFPVKNTGTVEVTANYKGAHGENYPAVFNYNYELSDKLYLENGEFGYINIDSNLKKMVNIFLNLKKLDLTNYEISKSDDKYILTYDEKAINEVLKTTFNKINVSIEAKDIFKKEKNIQIDLDDIHIDILKKDIVIKYQGILTYISLDSNLCYLNVNNKLKMNLFMKDNYSSNIVWNGQVYTLLLEDEGFLLKFNTSASIYNSISMTFKYEDVILNKNNKLENFKDNPIIRYISESDLSL